MKEIYNGQTVALGGPNLVTKELVVDDSTGEKAEFTYDKTTGAIAVQDEVDEDSVNPVTSRAVAKAIEQGGGTEYTAGDGIAIENDEISAKVDGTTIGVNADGELEVIGGGESFNPLLKNDIVVLPDGSYIGNYRDPDIDWYMRANSSTAYFQQLTTTSVGVLPYMRPWCYSEGGQGRFYTYLEGYSKTDVQDYIPVWIPGPGSGNSDCSCRLEYIGTSGRINATRQFIDPTYPEKPAESISCVGVQVLPPPSASNVFDVDTTLWNKVGDWSNLTVPLDRWYLGMFNTTTQEWLAFDYSTNRVGSDPFYHGGGPLYKVFVNIPAATSADAGKVLKIDSNGNPQWVTP